MTERAFIRPRSHVPLESGAARLLSAPGLPPDLLRQAARRLELVSLLLGIAFAVALALMASISSIGWYSRPHASARALVGVAMIAVSAAVYWLSRSGRLEPQRLLDAGLAYEVVVALGISMGDNLAPLTSDRPLEALSWLCLWIVMFPVIVPATPGKTLLASLLAASTWPLSFFLGLALGQQAPETRFVVMNFLENYIAAGLALVPAFVIRRLGADVERARAMGSYELVERINRGGMGEVWRARHRMLARPAAIKLIRPEALGADEGRVAETFVRRFEREAQATAALHSPHTIELYDFGVTHDGTFYYVMEILDGLDLEALVRRFGPQPAGRAIFLLLQACDSLADAHDAGLIHRDIKPANIHVCRMGRKCDFVKVLDFGLVRSTWADQEGDARLTMEGVASGTPAYMPPEVALGRPEADARADLYALGCVAYWLVTGQSVFEADNAMSMALQHVQALPVPPSRRTELPVPPSLERVILSCLEKDPERRPRSAEELALRLAACEQESPWTPDQALHWWQTHLPPKAEREPSR
jgi:serine/threonine-protein kinase